MIRKFIQKIWAKGTIAARAAHPPQWGHRTDIHVGQHRIDHQHIDARAIDVVKTLQHAGFEAYIVGGAVRDLLAGFVPKDFDVATNATPEQVKSLFRRAMIIGRRFRIVHVILGRGREHEVIEVSTFRAMVAAAAPPTLSSNPKQAFRQLEAREHAVDASGRVLRDNVWGSLQDDAARRDLSINAMYYDPVRAVLVDFHGGFEDTRQRRLRIIGDAAQRYREDPVRLIRLLRFAAKLGFDIDPASWAPVEAALPLLADVPVSRLFDEMVKLLQTGHGLRSMQTLQEWGFKGVFPILDVAMQQTDAAQKQFIEKALTNTDERVAAGKPVVPSFLLAALLWGDVDAQWQQRIRRGDKPVPALHEAMDAVFDARIGGITGRGKLGADMREIWAMQPRFERRIPSVARGMVAQPRFRAALDFLRLREQVGWVASGLAQWWESYWLADETERDQLLAQLRSPGRSGSAAKRTVTQDVADDSADAPVAPSSEPEIEGEVKRRRRRRRKPAASGDSA